MNTALAARPKRCLGALAAVVALAGCGSSAPVEPQSYPVTSKEGRFSVVFPGKPDTGVTQANSAEGTRKVTSTLAKKGSDDFGVTWSDFPTSFLAAGPTAVLEQVRDKVVGDVKGTLVSSEPITLDGKPGLAVEANVPTGPTKGTYVVRFYLVGNRMYEVLVIRNDPKADTTPMTDFFDSFELTGS